MGKNTIVVVIFSTFLFILPYAFSQTSEDNIFTNPPEWIKRTNIAIEGGSDKKPTYFFETIQPLLGTQDDDVVFFTQMRLSERSLRPIYNAGLGARWLLNTDFLLGINSFYDYQDLHRHSRTGVGFELFNSDGVEARLNTYFRVSRKRLVADTGTAEHFEKVANGLDGELGGPLPYTPFFRLYGGGYWYDFDTFKNKYGWKLRFEYNPLPYSRLNFEIFDDTKLSNPGYSIEGALTMGFTSFSPKDILRDFRVAAEAYPKVNLRKKVLHRVVRDFDITVIKSTKSKSTGITVEAGRT